MASDEKLRYAINHLFLPPKLPPEREKSSYDDKLIDDVLESLDAFTTIEKRFQDLLWSATQSVSNLKKTRQATTRFGKGDLERLLGKVADKHITMPLHVEAQNAAVIIQRPTQTNFVVFEIFELTPPHGEIITTRGRLRRCFPSQAVTVGVEKFKDPQFRASIAHTLGEMSSREVPEMMPASYGGNTTNPGIITDLFFNFLLANGSKHQPSQMLWKNTREEVTQQGGKTIPWRRSAVWLLLRVVLQLKLSESSDGRGSELYKRFVAFHLANMLQEAAKSQEIESDVLYVMSAKLARRLVKLDLTRCQRSMYTVDNSLRKTLEILRSRWMTVHANLRKPLEWEDLIKDVEQDIKLNLTELDRFITRDPYQATLSSERTINFDPNSGLMILSHNTFPSISSISAIKMSDTAGIYNLHAFEAWVADNLNQWLENHFEENTACESIAQAMITYHKIAEPAYKNSPGDISIMMLTILELWIACDKFAVKKHPLLANYQPGIPENAWQWLLLRFRIDTERLDRAESYVRDRIRNARQKSPPPIYGFGEAQSFPAIFCEGSDKHKELLKAIQVKAQGLYDCKVEEFQKLRASYHDLLDMYLATTCEDDQNRHGASHSSESCQRCQLKLEMDQMDIGVFEWPLPSVDVVAKSIIFEMAVPIVFGL